MITDERRSGGRAETESQRLHRPSRIQSTGLFRVSLERVFKVLGESPKGKTCKGMQGLIEEGSEVIEDDFEGSLMDAGLIGAAQRVGARIERRRPAQYNLQTPNGHR